MACNRYVYVAEGADRHVGLLLVDGRLVRTVKADQRRRPMEVEGQEILTRDKVTIRFNLTHRTGSGTR